MRFGVISCGLVPECPIGNCAFVWFAFGSVCDQVSLRAFFDNVVIFTVWVTCVTVVTWARVHGLGVVPCVTVASIAGLGTGAWFGNGLGAFPLGVGFVNTMMFMMVRWMLENDLLMVANVV